MSRKRYLMQDEILELLQKDFSDLSELSDENDTGGAEEIEINTIIYELCVEDDSEESGGRK